MFPVFLDTCVLLKPYVCDTLLSIAETGIYRPLRSPMVMAELGRNLARRGLDEKQIRHRIRPYDIQAVSQDTFLLDLRPADVIDALRRQASRYRREPRNTEALLAILGSPGSGCPGFAGTCRQRL